MLNTHLKFEAKISYGSKVVTFTSLKANLNLMVKVKVRSFLNSAKPHSLSLKVKFPRLKSCCIHMELHKILRFGLEGLGQRHQFSKPSEIFR